MKTDAGFVTLVHALMSTGSSHSIGDRVSRRVHSFQRDTINELIGLDVAAKRVTALDFAGLSPPMREAVELLEKHLEAWQQGRSTSIEAL